VRTTGSRLTKGASLAYHLTRPGVSDGKRLVVLEAKDVASGACTLTQTSYC